jgi:hypothetical protein
VLVEPFLKRFGFASIFRHFYQFFEDGSGNSVVPGSAPPRKAMVGKAWFCGDGNVYGTLVIGEYACRVRLAGVIPFANAVPEQRFSGGFVKVDRTLTDPGAALSLKAGLVLRTTMLFMVFSRVVAVRESH